jgi:glutamate N-acetyltransferase/amino-acid N-acetyltransferase
MSVVAAAGFRAAGVAAGIKADGGLDVALVVAEPGCLAAAVFTVNQAAAAPVRLSRKHLASGPATRAVVVNSGCANAGTGGAGLVAAADGAGVVAEALGCEPTEVLACSTGPIGPQLDTDAMRRGIEAAHGSLAADAAAGTAAATAMLTTDSVAKQAAVSGEFTVGGMAKGAGMVRPDMATMLAVLTTDAVVDPVVLDQALRHAVDRSFHALDIDGCASTNDAVIVMASGASGVAPSIAEVEDALDAVCRDLAHQVAADAEGATRVITIMVDGAADAAAARRLGRTVADSALVRASFFGGDPNWGRVLGALGTSPDPMEVDSISVTYAGTKVAEGGVAVPFDAGQLTSSLAEGDFVVEVSVGTGPGRAEILTTDLTPEYVLFNGEPS